MSYQSVILADSPSHYWRLGESSGTVAVDSVGGANGTISGGVTLNQPSPIVADGTGAMLFDGTGTIGVAGSVSLPVSCSVEGWLRYTVAGNHPFWGNWGVGGATGDTFEVGAAGGSAFVRITPTVDIVSAAAVTQNAWHHLVYVFNGSTVQFYVDGVLGDTRTAVRTVPAAGPSNLGLGVGIGNMTGVLDEVALYPRALTPTEISDHYAARLLTGAVDLNSALATYLHTTTDLTTDVSLWLTAHATGDATADFQRLIDLAS